MPTPPAIFGRSLCLRESALRLLCGLWWGGLALQASWVEARPATAAGHFPVTPVVQEQVSFWEKVFYVYPSTTSLIHDTQTPAFIIDIIDFKTWPKKQADAGELTQETRNRIVQAYMERYTLALRRFERYGEQAVKHGAIEQRIFAVYRRQREGLRRLYAGQVAIRNQGGLADEFVQAARRAQEYLPFMEATFRQHGLPIELTRLAFVESMFNLNAQSKVGASGIWQFMPGTARSFMRINHMVDERNSPYKATRGAAMLLADNYKSLRSWPLAVTAYNHGKAGMGRAVRRVGSRKLDHIITHYRASSFGFASRNFYSEFLAARNTYNRLLREQQVPRSGTNPTVAAITLAKPTSVARLLAATPLALRELRYFNRCLREQAYTKFRNHLLPANFQLFVPKNLANKILHALNRGGRSRYASSR